MSFCKPKYGHRILYIKRMSSVPPKMRTIYEVYGHSFCSRARKAKNHTNRLTYENEWFLTAAFKWYEH